MSPHRTELWNPSPEQLENLTPEKVRDLMVKCFVEAQRETLAHARTRMGLDSGLASVEHTVVSAVRAKFANVGRDFDNPTKDGIVAVLSELGDQARAMGTPEDIIARHHAIMRKAIAQIA
jgi:hypothetical protein